MRLGIVLLLGISVSSTVRGGLLSVGPGRPFATPCQAFAAANHGDVIEIDAAGNYDGDVCVITKNNLVIRGVNGRARIDAAGRNAAGKGIWVVAGDNTVIENIEFSGARVPDRNGAGIRLDSGNLTVRNCVFRNNENGILGGFYGKVLVEHSEFENNGYGDGFSHNIYLNAGVAEFTLRYSASRRANAGHLVKSRAAKNYILYNRLTQEDGSGSYEIDLSNAGLAFVIGNVLQQGDTTRNRGMLSYGFEGQHASAPNQLYVVNNTFVSTRAAGATFIQVGSSVAAQPVIRNNIFSGPGNFTLPAGAQMAGNVSSGEMGFLNPAQFDYRISNLSAALNAGVDPGEADGFPLRPAMQYVHPLCAVARHDVGPIDAGAFEHGVIEANPVCPGPPSAHGLASLSVSAAAVESGSPLEVVIGLTSPAPAGGSVVALSSSAPAALAVPAAVTVPAGETGISVPVTAGQVTAATTVRLTASLGSTGAEATVTVLPKPPELAAFTLSSASVESGSSLAVHISLTLPAPAGGTSVALSSSMPSALPVPAAVTVPEGQSSLSFLITAGEVSTSTAVTVTARLVSNTLAATATVHPRPVLATLARMTRSAPQVRPGERFSLTVQLATAAPPAGVLVRFSASRSDVELPASMVVPAGASSATVHGSVKQQAAAGTVTIQAASANTVSTSISIRAPR
jgi:hypothetical protein